MLPVESLVTVEHYRGSSVEWDLNDYRWPREMGGVA